MWESSSELSQHPKSIGAKEWVLGVEMEKGIWISGNGGKRKRKMRWTIFFKGRYKKKKEWMILKIKGEKKEGKIKEKPLF